VIENEVFMEIAESWRVVDQWWTDNPKVTYWIALRAPDGNTAAISYEIREKNWTFHGDPRPEIKIET
jgi:hypothetical protein